MTNRIKSVPFSNAKAGFLSIQNYILELGYKKGTVEYNDAFTTELAFRRKFQSYL